MQLQQYRIFWPADAFRQVSAPVAAQFKFHFLIGWHNQNKNLLTVAALKSNEAAQFLLYDSDFTAQSYFVPQTQLNSSSRSMINNNSNTNADGMDLAMKQLNSVQRVKRIIKEITTANDNIASMSEAQIRE